jgi:hypothetical protein
LSFLITITILHQIFYPLSSSATTLSSTRSPAHIVVALIVYKNTDFIISRMDEAYGVRRTLRHQTEAEKYNESKLKSEINVQRRHMEAARDCLNAAACNYADQMKILINKLEKLDEMDPALALNVDAVKDTINRDGNSMEELFRTLAGFLGLKRINGKPNGKNDEESEGFVMVSN